jgi:DNA-binding NarL/FixJ family response regulator
MARGVERVEERITEREMEIVKFVADGLNNREIAELLCISRHTVKTHVQRVYQKLHISSRIKLAFWFQGKK